MLIQWSDRFVTGNALVDQQHQALFEAINVFDEAVRGGGGQEEVTKAMAFLAHYAGEHFATEERLMMKAKFPRLGLHAMEHAGLAHRVKFILDMREADPAKVPVEGVSRFVADWLVNHILGWDMAFFEFLRQESTVAAQEAGEP